MSKTKETKDDGKAEALKIALSQIEKDFGKGAIMTLNSSEVHDVPVISTGSIGLNITLGCGGLPRGRIIEIYGQEGTGKSSLAMQTVAECQRTGGTAAYIDAEAAFNLDYAQHLGIDLDSLLLSQPDCGEEGLTIAETLINSNAVDIVVVDSVAALVPRKELEGEMGESGMALQARLMSSALRKITTAISKTKTCMIFINQLRSKIGIVYGSPDITAGGNALKYYASIRLDVRRKETIKNTAGEVLGNTIRIKVVKNKLAPPFREYEADLYFGRGIDPVMDLINVAVTKKVIDQKGAWYSFGGKQLGQGKDGVREALLADPATATKLQDLVYQVCGIKQPVGKA